MTDTREALAQQAITIAAGIDHLQDSMSLRRKAAEILNECAAALRQPGDTPKEIGQAQACLETLACSIGLSSDGEAALEFNRVRAIPKEEWQRRHAAKVALGIAS